MNLTNAAESTTHVHAPLVVWRSRLLLAVWAVITFAYLAVFVIDLGLSYGLMAVSCNGPDCHYQAISSAEAAALLSWGLSVPVYALYMLGISVVPVIAFTALGLVMLTRLYPQPRSYVYALMPITIPVLAITNFDVVLSAYPSLSVPIHLMAVLGFLLLVTFALISPRDRFDPRWTVILPFLAAVIGVYSMFWGDELSLPVPFTILLLVISTVVLYRYRRLFVETERRQTKWVVMGLLVFFAGVPLWTYTFEIAAPDTARDMLLITLGGWTLIMLMTLFLPIATFIAIFRHQLWDINLILNRTLVYGSLTAGIIAVYALTVGGLGTMLHTDSNFVLSLFATGLIAILFQPIRERLQRAVNRMMFGERDDPYSVLSQLGHRLQETAAPDQMLLAITATITQTLKLPYAAVEVETVDGDHRPVAVTGHRSFAVAEWPLRYQGQIIGRLVAGTRSPGENFNSQERQLLADIASQAGAVAYAVRLTTALQQSRERLVLAREEERRRIRRDLHDELGPSLASQTFQFDTVLELMDTDQQAAVELLHSLKQRNQSLVGDVRRLVYELRPPALDELGLLGALRAHFDQIASPTITLTAMPEPLPVLPAAIEVAAYRIALEAVNNVMRHAGADHCTVALAIRSGQLHLAIEDDGAGMIAGAATGIGLRSMRERAEEVGGTFGIESSAPGARVTALLPLEVS